jgi:hypothetical protein
MLPQAPTFRGPYGTGKREVTVQDSRFVGRGKFTGTGLVLMWELGLLSPTISTAIRLWRMGFISKNSLIHFQRERASNRATFSYIRPSPY